MSLADLHLFGLRLRYVLLLATVAATLLILAVRAVWSIVEARTMAGVFNCPGCASTSVGRSASKKLWDGIFGVFGCSPYRCEACGERYFRAG